MHLTNVKNLLVSNSNGHFKKDSALELRVLAQKSVATADKALPVQITHSVTQIELLDSQIDKVESEIRDIVSSLNSVIMTIPSIGLINGGMTLGEIGDINRFSKPRRPPAYAELDPSVYQSGKFSAKKTRMSKRRYSAFSYDLMNVVKKNQTFREYLNSTCIEGRGNYNVLGHCTGKLTRVIYKIMRDNVKCNLD